MNDFQNIGKLLDSEVFYRHATLCFVLGKERDLTPQRRKVCAIFVSMYVCMYALECSVTYIPFIIFNHSSHNLYIFIHTYIHHTSYIHTFIYTYIHTYIHTYCTYAYIYTYIQYINTYKNSYIYTYTIHSTYIHTLQLIESCFEKYSGLVQDTMLNFYKAQVFFKMAEFYQKQNNRHKTLVVLQKFSQGVPYIHTVHTYIHALNQLYTHVRHTYIHYYLTIFIHSYTHGYCHLCTPFHIHHHTYMYMHTYIHTCMIRYLINDNFNTFNGF